jgi:hypothetical protein
MHSGGSNPVSAVNYLYYISRISLSRTSLASLVSLPVNKNLRGPISYFPPGIDNPSLFPKNPDLGV